MKAKRANWLFLTIIFVHFGVLLFIYMLRVADISMVTDSLLSEGIIMIPALLFLIPEAAGTEGKNGIGQALGFRKIKGSTLLLVILFMILMSPLVTLVNAFTMLYTDNEVADLTPEILKLPFPVMLFLIGIFAPFCEEFVFRGLIFHGYRKTQAGIWPVIISALLFGLMHLNFNQAAYAFVIGIALALLVDATGSLWSSVAFHMVFNSAEVCLIYFAGAEIPEMLNEQYTHDTLMTAIAVYMILALISTALAACVMVLIAKNEHRERELAVSVKSDIKGQAPLVSAPLIIAIVICLTYMLIVQYYLY
jgi:membrane protease YdiL (CAAX protease family)